MSEGTTWTLCGWLAKKPADEPGTDSKWQARVQPKAMFFQVEPSLVAIDSIVHVQGKTNPTQKSQFSTVLGTRKSIKMRSLSEKHTVE